MRYFPTETEKGTGIETGTGAGTGRLGKQERSAVKLRNSRQVVNPSVVALAQSTPPVREIEMVSSIEYSAVYSWTLFVVDSSY